MNIDELLRHTVERGASDLHLKVGNVPFLRVDGDLQPAPFAELTSEDAAAFALSKEILPDGRRRLCLRRRSKKRTRPSRQKRTR